METLSYSQKLLVRLLSFYGLGKAEVISVVGHLQTEEEVVEMLQYIVDNQDSDRTTLYSRALTISQNHKNEIEY